jgi:diguanylate cyclase (GGDEF)-like protein
LRRLIPASLYVFYFYDQIADALEAKHVVGDGASLVRGLRITLGERLSGWVAAHRRTISNSDPVLDLGDIARSPTLKFRNCLSTPLLNGKELVGVLSLYSADLRGFTEDHRRIIEVIAHQIALTLKHAIALDETPRCDHLTGLPHLNQLEQLVELNSADSGGAIALLFIDMIGLKMVNRQYGREVGDEALRHVATQARRGLRANDILFRNTSDGFVALMHATDADTAESIANRIRERISEHPISASKSDTITIESRVTVVCSPRDGVSLTDLLGAARRKTSTSLDSDSRRIH